MSGAAGENVDRDLYSDLVEDGETMVRTQNVALRERVKMHENEILSIRLQLQDTGEANVRLKEENLTLEKNISCLYKTAVLVRRVSLDSISFAKDERLFPSFSGHTLDGVNSSRAPSFLQN